jgi:hypothetical protein
VNFRQRFFRYGIGVAIGLMLSIFFFQGRGCSDWLPEKRIKSRMQLDGVRPSDPLACWMQCDSDAVDVTISELMQWLLESEVIWSASSPREETPCYTLYMQDNCPVRQLEVCFGPEMGTINLTAASGIGLDGCSCP